MSLVSDFPQADDFIAYEIQENAAAYLAAANVNGIQSIEDLVRFNEEHASRELPPSQVCKAAPFHLTNDACL